MRTGRISLIKKHKTPIELQGKLYNLSYEMTEYINMLVMTNVTKYG
jgi:hypothetical protein